MINGALNATVAWHLTIVYTSGEEQSNGSSGVNYRCVIIESQVSKKI